MNKKNSELEQLKTDVVSLKIRVRRLEQFVKSVPNPDDYLDSSGMTEENGDDVLLEQATEIVQQYDKVSASLLQRRLEIGYARAARLMDQLETKKIISSSDGSSFPRDVLIKKDKNK